MAKVLKSAEAPKKLEHIKYVKNASKEERFQQRVRKMQIAVAEGKVRLAERTERIAKDLAAIMTTRAKLRILGLPDAADFTALRKMVEKDLANVNAETLATENAEKARREKAKAVHVTKEQEQIIDRFYGVQGQIELQEIARIKGVLEQEAKKPQTVAQAQNNVPAPAVVS